MPVHPAPHNCRAQVCVCVGPGLPDSPAWLAMAAASTVPVHFGGVPLLQVPSLLFPLPVNLLYVVVVWVPLA